MQEPLTRCSTAIKRQLEFREAGRVIARTKNRWWEDCPTQQGLIHIWGDFCTDRNILVRDTQREESLRGNVITEGISITHLCVKQAPSASFAAGALEVWA